MPAPLTYLDVARSVLSPKLLQRRTGNPSSVLQAGKIPRQLHARPRPWSIRSRPFLALDRQAIPSLCIYIIRTSSHCHTIDSGLSTATLTTNYLFRSRLFMLKIMRTRNRKPHRLRSFIYSIPVVFYLLHTTRKATFYIIVSPESWVFCGRKSQCQKKKRWQ